MANSGYVYLLSNISMPNIYKIGYTKRILSERVDELSRSTSCPTNFEVVCFAEFENCVLAERDMHNIFSQYRVNDKKEFFKFSISDLITYACYSLCEPFESSCINSSKSEKFNYFLKLFHKDIEYI